MRLGWWCWAAALATVAPACSDGDEAPCEPIALEVEGSRLLYCDGGWFDLVDDGGAPILSRAVGVARLDATDESGARLSTDGARERSVEQVSETDALGAADRLIVTARGAGGAPDLRWTLSAYPAGGFYTFDLAVVNDTGAPVRVAKLAPVRADADAGGGLYLGSHPSTHRILENGSYTLLDFLAEVVPGDASQNEAYANLAPGDFAGHSVANWNHAVADLDGPAVWIAGALTFERSLPVLNLSYDDETPAPELDGRTGFTYFSAEAAYQPAPKPVADGAALASELYYVHPGEPNLLVGVERYADAVATHLGLELWHHRDPNRRIPNGWNSWAGSGSTGGYGTDIDEDLMIANLDVMATELRDWGMDWFQIDDGYELWYGDWQWNTERFPNGPAWLTDQIRARGLKPGLWMAPFTADEESSLYAEHPDWFADKTAIGAFLVSDKEILDLTHPEVQQYLHELFATFRDDWGFDWLKMDFAYGALGGEGFTDPSKTREEAWRDALAIIRDELGDDTFFLLVGTIGMNYGLVDSGRTTLDTMPVWDWEPGSSPDDHFEQQGFKPTVRTAGRRWYLQDRVWINHPDLIFFRSNPNDDAWPRVTLSESQALCSFVGLSGGIVKLGERLVDLQADHINTVRKLLPIYGSAARPLDVLTREFPEVWHLSVTAPLDGYDEQWELIGLFHWGRNVDMSVNPYVEIPDTDTPRSHDVDLAAQGLDGVWLAYEFWTQQLLGEVSGRLALDVPPHSARVVALRRKTGAPQFLGWNRQITMGGTLLGEVTWTEATGVLHLETTVAAPTAKAPFTYEIALFVPDGYAYASIDTTGTAVDALEVVVDGDVARVRFVPQATGPLALDVSFAAAAP